SNNGGNIQRRVFLRSGSCGSFGRAGSNGILPLPIMQVVVSCPGQCFHSLEARRRAGYCRCGTCCHVSKDQIQSTAILQGMRWPSHDQSSYDRIGGCICSDVTHLEVQRGCPHQLCRHSFTYAGRTPQAEGFSQRVWRLRRSPARVRKGVLFAAAHESAISPKRTSLVAPHMSAFGGKADMPFCESPLLRSLLGVKRT